MSNKLENKIRINSLLDFYGSLLTITQQKMISLYYGEDLSLGEISEIEGVSRNAVFDSIKKGTTLLESIESKLHLLEKEEKMNSFFNQLKKENLSKEQLEIIDRIIEKEHE